MVPVPEDIELLLLLIREDLKAHKLSACLHEIGCTGSPYLADLSEMVLQKAGFHERPNQLYTFYFNLLTECCTQLNGND